MACSAARTGSDGYGWEAPTWLAGALGWIDHQVVRLGLRITSTPRQVHVRPWSTVLRVPTGHGDLWFKANASGSAHEGRLCRELAQLAPSHIPSVLAADDDRGWLLIADAGTSLTRFMRPGDGLAALERAIVAYGQLQRRVAPYSDRLLHAGAMDCRPQSLPGHLASLLDSSSPGTRWAEGFSTTERDLLYRLRPQVADWCRELADLDIPSTIQHDDLHPGNIFLRDDCHIFIDWADACVAHPFGSLLYPLALAAEQPGSASSIRRLRDAYLEPWTDTHGRVELRVAVSLATRVAAVARALIWRRAVHDVARSAIKDYYATGVARWLTRLREGSWTW